MSTIQPIRPAATVILVREAAQGYEIFMLRRTSAAAFAGGMYVFPGGRVDGDDHLHAYDPWRVGPSPTQQPQQRALGDEWRGYWIAGIRESFEEAGLLLAYDADGRILAYPDAATRARFHAYREPLHAGALTLADICVREGLKLAVDRIHFLNRFVTPFGRPRRFDTRFFVAAAPPGQTGTHDAVETVDSVWISPEEALARHDAREFDLMRVTRMQLEMLAGFASVDTLMDHAASRTEFAIHRPQVGVDG
ncbi:MAG: NUDIX hydrolase [Pseudomonadales bacterium]|jgi:8-oxo-dGTP pyrophosphatase MutT (NUDIX family)